MSSPTPESLLEGFHSLTSSQRREFLTLLGAASTAIEVSAAVAALDLSERTRLMEMQTLPWVKEVAMPALLWAAAQTIRANPSVSDEEFGLKLFDAFSESFTNKYEYIAKFEIDQYKKVRNRSSSINIIKRNAEICRLKIGDPKSSYRKLAKQFGISHETVKSILKESDKWQKLDSESQGDD